MTTNRKERHDMGDEDIDIEEKVDMFMQHEVHEHELYGTDHPPEVTVAFFEALIGRLEEEVNAMRQEHGLT